MEITINDQTKIFAIQKEFSEIFPSLKLEFYSKPSEAGGSPSAKIMRHISKTIAECRTVHSSGSITVQPQMTIGELEQAFQDVYGLSVLIFSKSANDWIQVTETKDWTLAKQNE